MKRYPKRRSTEIDSHRYNTRKRHMTSDESEEYPKYNTRKRYLKPIIDQIFDDSDLTDIPFLSEEDGVVKTMIHDSDGVGSGDGNDSGDGSINDLDRGSDSHSNQKDRGSDSHSNQKDTREIPHNTINTNKRPTRVQFMSSEFDAEIPESGNELVIKQTQVPEELSEVSDDGVEDLSEDGVDGLGLDHDQDKDQETDSEFGDAVQISETNSEITEISSDEQRFTRLRSQRKFPSQRQQQRKKLRSKKSIDYSKQLMPANFTQILDKEFGRDRDHSNTRRNDHQNDKSDKKTKRLNESDDETQPVVFKNRTLALLSKSQHNKNTIIPQNMDDMLYAEQQRLLNHVSVDVKDQFLKHCPGFKEQHKVGFDMVAGFDEHIMALKEMVGLPLMYPDLFQQFGVTPPKGVLFHGPPGTGKTLMARALAQSCSMNGKPVAFFVRKGADVLNKWVGESEKQLRLLFEQAKAWGPSIIFFDEIDGLAPVRSSKQDQIHSSIVSTLLSLMDGLESRGQVVVIGATNRIDSIDPALRRPGRFDREFFFGLPKEDARMRILEMNTKEWKGVDRSMLETLAQMTHGYNGADVKQLCTEAALNAVRRSFPQIYKSDVVYDIPSGGIDVSMQDFLESMAKRSGLHVGKPIPLTMALLLEKNHSVLSTWVNRIVPLIHQATMSRPFPNQVRIYDYLKSFSPKLLLYGSPHNGVDSLALDLVAQLEQLKFYIKTLDLNGLVSHHETTESLITGCFHELKRHAKHVLFMPRLDSWWGALPEPSQELLMQFIKGLGNTFVIITTEWEEDQVPGEWSRLFPFTCAEQVGAWRLAYRVDAPTSDTRRAYFDQVFQDLKTPVPVIESTSLVELKPRTIVQKEWDEKELECIVKEYHQHQLLVRKTFGSMLDTLRKDHKLFHKLPDLSIDLERMQIRLFKNHYETSDDVMRDVHLLMREFGTTIRSKTFLDDCVDMMESLTDEFVQQCWYFYLFRRFLDSREDGIDDSDDEVVATQFPTDVVVDVDDVVDQVTVQTPIIDDEIHLDSDSDRDSLLDSFKPPKRVEWSVQEKTRLVDFFVSLTNGWTVDQVHDIVVTLAGLILEKPNVSVDEIISEYS